MKPWFTEYQIHFQKAEDLLRKDPPSTWDIAQANVHAVLAQAAATRGIGQNEEVR